MHDDTISFDKIELSFLGAEFTAKSDTAIMMGNARDILTYKIETSNIQFLHQLTLPSGKNASVLLHGIYNTGFVVVKLNANEIPCDLSAKLTAVDGIELESKCSVALLQSEKTIHDLDISDFSIRNIKDKKLALIIRFLVLPLQDFTKKPLFKLSIEGMFQQSSGRVVKKAETLLSFGKPLSFHFDYRTHAEIYALDIKNKFGLPAKIEKLTIGGETQLTNIDLLNKEVYSCCFDNSEGKKEEVVLEMAYSLPATAVVL